MPPDSADGRTAETVVVLPVFDDWLPLQSVLADLDAALAAAGVSADVLLVDDGSTRQRPPGFSVPAAALRGAELLRLRRNLGHQRAIAVALSYLHEHRRYRRLVIMDADGEDLPSDVPRLLRELDAHEGECVVFAERLRRSEGLLFTAGYHAYRLLHHALTGIAVRVGNFSALSFESLQRLVTSAELWNHYAAAVFRSRVPMARVPTRRGRRRGGEPRMSLVSLIGHGLSAISVFGDVVAVRLLILAACAFAAASGAWLALVVLGPPPARALALENGVTLALLGLQGVLAALLFAFLVLASRSSFAFLPVRDCRHFVAADPQPLPRE